MIRQSPQSMESFKTELLESDDCPLAGLDPVTDSILKRIGTKYWIAERGRSAYDGLFSYVFFHSILSTLASLPASALTPVFIHTDLPELGLVGLSLAT